MLIHDDFDSAPDNFDCVVLSLALAPLALLGSAILSWCLINQPFAFLIWSPDHCHIIRDDNEVIIDE